MEHRKLNFAIPLYFDNSVSYLELVGHLSKGFEDIHQEFEQIKVDWSKIQTEFTLVKQDWEALEQFKTDLTNQEAQHVADMTSRADSFEAEIRAQQEQHEQKVDGIVNTFNGRITNLETGVEHIKDGTIKVENASHADVADKLSTARTISLTGDVTGSTTFDGSSNVSISCTVLGTGDTGNLVTRVSTLESKVTGIEEVEIPRIDTSVASVETSVAKISNTDIPGIKSRLDTLETNSRVHEIGSTVPQTLAVGHIYFQIPTE